MSRNNSEDAQLFKSIFQSGKFSHSRRVLAGDVAVTVDGSLINFFDPNGANRTVTLPATDDGLFYVVSNIGTAYNVLVKTAAASLVTTLLPGDTALVVASATEWAALRGWAALAVFTNTVNGLVPAPNSAVPGSLFLRDDGQWGQVQVVGIVDAFKYVTDGTNTAIGSGPDTLRFRSSTSKIGITVTNNEAVFGDNVNLTVLEAAVDHNALLNYVADRHVAHSGVTVTAGLGLSGGGTLASSFSLDFDPSEFTVATPALTDHALWSTVSGSAPRRVLWSGVNGVLVHDNLSGYVADRHVAHTSVSMIAGEGLSGGGDISASRTFNLDFTELATDDQFASADYIPFYDVSESDHGRRTVADLNSVLDHNSLANYVADQHVAHSGVTFTAGAGLTGGGTLAASRTFDVGAGAGIAVNADDVALNFNGLTTDTPVLADIVAFYDISGSDHNKATFTALNAIFDHNALVNYSANRHIDHTAVSVIAGAGLTGGGTIDANTTLNIGAGTGITVNADDVALAAIATARVLGNVSGSSAAPTALTGTQLTTLVDTFTTTLKGLVPAPGSVTSKFLRDDGTWNTPPGGGGNSDLANHALLGGI